MSTQAKFHELAQQNMDTLKQYVPIVAKVHGGHHPEFHDVRKIFDTFCQKVEAAGKGMPKLDEEFEAFRKITDNYAVPGDTCETYEAVYRMLGEMDQAYHEGA